MNYPWYLFRFEGRINRARYWLAGLILVCWVICLAMLIFGVAKIFDSAPGSLSLDIDDIFGVADPESFRALSPAQLVPLLFKVVGMPLFLWVYLATSIKRLHDRNKSGWWMFPFFVIPGLFGQFADRLGDSAAIAVPGAVVFIVMLWGWITMYFLKGTAGTNRFGADPLATVETRPGWDQNRELEFVPHSAGPSPGPHVNRGHE